MQSGMSFIPPCIPDSHPYRITNTKYRINTVISPDDGHIVDGNMYRKDVNILRKIVCQVGFIYKIRPAMYVFVTFSCVRLTIVTVKKAITNIMSVRLYSCLSYPLCKAHTPYYTVICGLFSSTTAF